MGVGWGKGAQRIDEKDEPGGECLYSFHHQCCINTEGMERDRDRETERLRETERERELEL